MYVYMYILYMLYIVYILYIYVYVYVKTYACTSIDTYILIHIHNSIGSHKGGPATPAPDVWVAGAHRRRRNRRCAAGRGTAEPSGHSTGSVGRPDRGHCIGMGRLQRYDARNASPTKKNTNRCLPRRNQPNAIAQDAQPSLMPEPQDVLWRTRSPFRPQVQARFIKWKKERSQNNHQNTNRLSVVNINICVANIW